MTSEALRKLSSPDIIKLSWLHPPCHTHSCYPTLMGEWRFYIQRWYTSWVCIYNLVQQCSPLRCGLSGRAKHQPWFLHTGQRAVWIFSTTQSFSQHPISPPASWQSRGQRWVQGDWKITLFWSRWLYCTLHRASLYFLFRNCVQFYYCHRSEDRGLDKVNALIRQSIVSISVKNV